MPAESRENPLMKTGNFNAFFREKCLTKNKSVPTTKKGSPYLRKTLFQIMDGLIKRSPVDDPVYAFMDKKRAQGKPYYVYMTAGANKFLRIYYGRVREYLASLSEAEEI